MAQFDLHRLSDGMLVVDLQTDLIGLNATRIVAPLRAAADYVSFPGLTPTLEVEGRLWVVRLQEMASVPAHELGRPVGNARPIQDDLLRGLDILIRGF